MLTIAVVVSSAFAIEPIRDAVTGGTVDEAVLARSPAFVAVAPLSDVLDMLTLLSKTQHIALLATVLLLFALQRAFSAWRGRSSVREHLVATGGLLLAIVVTYAAMALLPRPMASLTVNDGNVLRVDFHSHTSASHDGRPGWSAEDNRAWHRDGGYDVVYITDHASVAAAEQGLVRNANPAGDGVTILQGIEVTWTGEHVNVLGAERTYKGLFTPNGRDIDEQALRLASLIPGREPVVIWNHPHHLDRLPTAAGNGTPGVRGIEATNGAPDSMDELRRERDALVSFGRQKQLTFVSGSDNHGWGMTAPNWTLMVMFGWRGASPDSLAKLIEALVRRGGPNATHVVERRSAEALSPVSAAATIVTAPAVMFATISNEERVSWLVWTWAITFAVWWMRRRRARTVAA